MLDAYWTSLASDPLPALLLTGLLSLAGVLAVLLGRIAQAMEGEKMQAPPQAMNGEPAMPADDNPERAKYRQAIVRYMRENGMEPPQRIMAELQSARILRAVYSERQLQEVMVDFWTNHFNVYAQKGADRWFLTSYDRDVIRPNALGNFRDLLEATAKSRPRWASKAVVRSSMRDLFSLTSFALGGGRGSPRSRWPWAPSALAGCSRSIPICPRRCWPRRRPPAPPAATPARRSSRRARTPPPPPS